MAKKFLSDIELDAGLVDGSNSTGASGYLLSSTGAATSWVDPAAVSVGESEQVHIACKNTSGVAISKGDPVYITGTVGTSFRIEIAAADASNVNKMPAVGLAESDLAHNAEGFVIVSGVLKNLTTDPLSTGDGTPSSNDTVYVKAGGGLTKTKPTGSGNLIQNVGKVGRVNSSNAGSLAVSTIMRTNDVPNLTTGKIWVGSSTYTTESGVIHLDETNNRLGVNETSPSSELHVNNDSTNPELRLSYETVSGYGGGGSIRIQGGASDYVNGGIGWYNGANRDAHFQYAAAPREMSFRVNERGITTNGYFRFYNGSTEVAEINAAGIYGNVFYDQGNTSYYLDPAGSSSLNTINVTTINRNPTVTLSGDVSGSATMTNLNSINITTTVADDSHSHSNYLLNNSDDTTSGSLTVGSTSSTANKSLKVLAGDSYIASIEAYGGSQGTGKLYVGQASNYGGGIMYNGDDNPNLPQTTDAISFYRRTNNTEVEVFSYPHGSSVVTFASDIVINGGDITLGGTGRIQGVDTVSAGTDAANKTYVDNAVTGLTEYVAVAGDTMTGPLVIDESDTTDKWLFRVDNNGSNFSGFWSASQDIQLYLRDDAGNVRVQLRPDARSFFYDGLEAANLYDSDNTSYYLNPGGTSNLQELEILRNSSNYTVNLADAHDRAGLMVKSSTNFDSKLAFSSGASSRQYIQALNNAHTTGRDIAINPYGGNVAIGKEAPSEALDVDGSITSNATIWTGYDSGVTNSVSCSNWFRSSGSTGWYSASYGGGIYMVDSTWVRVYNNKKFYADNTIESNSGMYAPIFYDRNNTNYRFNGDASKDGVDLTSSGNFAINVLGTIGGGHIKHNNLETPEMQWSVGGSTDLNWKKLCDIVISDATYSGWGAEIEITDFSGNFGNAMYNGGELYKGALSIYHWGGSGTYTETPYATIPYQFRNDIRWYKIQESGQNRYELQVKSPANYRQLYIKVKPGIGNQIADIISYANDTNGTTTGGTAYTSLQYGDFNQEHAGHFYVNDNQLIGFRNGYGSPYFTNYYGALTTSSTLYVGGPFSTTTSLYAGPTYGSIFYDRNNSTYYMDGSSTGDSIRVAGDVVAYYSSDKRLKDNIKPIENALDKVNAISGVTFEWNEKSHKTTGRKDVGVVAQEVEEVFPEIVETRSNGYKAVDYQKLTAVLIESVKELTAKVEALESKQCK